MTTDTAPLTGDQILGSIDRKPLFIDVPEWGGKVGIVVPSYGDIRSLGRGEIDYALALVVAACVNPDGSKMFTTDDVDALSQKHPKAIEAIVQQVNLLARPDIAEKN